jgi:hypothetical protein
MTQHNLRVCRQYCLFPHGVSVDGRRTHGPKQIAFTISLNPGVQSGKICHDRQIDMPARRLTQRNPIAQAHQIAANAVDPDEESLAWPAVPIDRFGRISVCLNECCAGRPENSTCIARGRVKVTDHSLVPSSNRTDRRPHSSPGTSARGPRLDVFRRHAQNLIRSR